MVTKSVARTVTKMSNIVRNSRPALLISLIVGLVMLPYPSIGSNYYVKPSMASECPDSDMLPCKTLEEYANNNGDLNGEVTMLFLAGVHNLTTELDLSNLISFQMKPVSDATDTTNEKVIIQLFSLDMMFTSISQGVTFERLTISSIYNGKHSTTLTLRNSLATFQQLHLIGVSVVVMVVAGNLITITIMDSNIERSRGSGLQLIDSRSSGTLNLCIKYSNISHHLQGGIVVDSSSTRLHVNISGSNIESNNITFSGSAAFNAAGLSVCTTRSDNATVTIQNSHFINNRDMRVQYSSGILQDLKGNSMVVYVLRAVVIIIINSEFRDNHGTAIGAVNIEQNVHFYGNVSFHGNTAQQGGALAMVSTLVYFMPQSRLLFVNNAADDVGGAIFVVLTSAMYEDNDQNTCVDCFYKLPSWEQSSTDYSVIFSNNSAKNGGQHIYGASLISYCVVYEDNENTIRSNDGDVQRLFQFDKQNVSPISSNPSRVCILDEKDHHRPPSEYCVDKSQILKSITTFPGEEFFFNAVLTGAEFGTGTGAVYVQFLPNRDNQASLHPTYQYSQRISQLNTTQSIYYSVYSKNTYEVLVLTAVDSTISTNGNDNDIEQAIEIYKESNVIPSLLLTTPVYINVTLSDCPPGFYLNSNSSGCECNPVLCNAQVTGNFSNGSGLIYLGESLWVNAYTNVNENVSGIILHRNCPFDYCNLNSEGIDLNDSDSQCAMKHAGILCGRCESGFSLAIGSNNCLSCQDSNGLSLLTFFAAAGFLLVFFIKILNMTVSQGTINGLIFYANIIWAYQNIFFPNSTVVYFRFFYTFLAWINLDFGIETCFVKDLTAFWKTWLQFLFPLYIWSIAGGIILVASCSKRMTKLFGNNPVHVLATLFLLSYAKLLRTVIAVLYPATLYVYRDNGEPVKSLTQTVWALDGNLLYGGVPHIFLLLVVVLIVIPFLWAPYTICLLFIQSLRRNSSYRCLKWVNRLKPLIDSYVGPLNSSNHHWVGLLLLARFILFLVFTSTYANDPFASLLSLVIVIVFLLVVLSYTGRLYDHPTRFKSRFLPETVSFRSILEVSFLFNLVVVSVITLYLREDATSMEVFVSISVGITLIQFIGIVLFHVFSITKNIIILCPCDVKKREKSNYKHMTTIPTTSTVSVTSDSSPRVYQDYHHASYDSAKYREQLLSDSNSSYESIISTT